MQILVADIGNTRSTLGLFNACRLIWRRDLATDAVCSGTEALVVERCDACVVSCVSARAAFFSDLLKRQMKCPVFEVSAAQSGLEIHYAHPERLGQDRVANALAASIYSMTGAIVIDCGTATHFDVISPSGAFYGGPILAGVETMAEALVQRIPHLPAVELDPDADALSQDTISAINAGTIYAAAGGIERIVREICARVSYCPKTILTGGNARYIEPHINYNLWVPDLTLEGLCVYGERVLARMGRISA